MTEPTPTPKLDQAIAKAMEMASSQAHDARNEYHRYKYTSSEAMIGEGRRCLAANGVSLLPVHCQLRLDTEPPTIEVTYRIACEGEAVLLPTVNAVLEEKGRPLDKAIATARTYTLAYLLRDILLLDRPDDEHSVDKRDDSAHEPPKRSGQRKSAARPQMSEKAKLWNELLELRSKMGFDPVKPAGDDVPRSIEQLRQAVALLKEEDEIESQANREEV
jgi:hypothetical protein